MSRMLESIAALHISVLQSTIAMQTMHAVRPLRGPVLQNTVWMHSVV